MCFFFFPSLCSRCQKGISGANIVEQNTSSMQKMLMLQLLLQQKLLKMRSLLFSWNLMIFWLAKLGGRYSFLVDYLIYLFLNTDIFFLHLYVFIFWIEKYWVARYFLFQIRCVDPTLNMEADEGDDYTHLPVSWITPTFILRQYILESSYSLMNYSIQMVSLYFKLQLRNKTRVCIFWLSYTNFL